MAKHVFSFVVTHPSFPVGANGLRTIEAVNEDSRSHSEDDLDVFLSLMEHSGRNTLRGIAQRMLGDPTYFEKNQLFDLRQVALERVPKEYAKGPDMGDYSKRVKAIVAEMKLIDVKLVGDRKRYMGHGSYPEDEGGGLWKEEVLATCDSEAEFLTRMKMAEELCWTSTPENPRDLFSLIEDLNEFDTEATPIQANDPEFEEGFEALLKAAIEAGMDGEVVERAAELLRKVGREVEIPSGIKP